MVAVRSSQCHEPPVSRKKTRRVLPCPRMRQRDSDMGLEQRRDSSCGGSGGALHVPSASIVFGYGFYGLETTESAVTTSGIRQTPKGPPGTASRNLPLQDCSRAQKVGAVRDLGFLRTSGTGLGSLACLVRRQDTLVSRSRFHTIV